MVKNTVISVENAEINYVILKIFEENNKFKFKLFASQTKNKTNDQLPLLFESKYEFLSLKEVNNIAFNTIDKIFPIDEKTFAEETCGPNSRD